MAISKIHHSARALLFERLLDAEPSDAFEHRAFRTLNTAQLKESVRRELEQLLNTRCSIPEELLRERELSVIDYGIPDFSQRSTRNSADFRHIALMVQRVIERFEPRLQDVAVLVEQYADQHKALFMTIEGNLVLDAVREPISFPSTHGQGEWKVYAGE